MVGFGFIAGVIAMLLVLFVATNVVITARQALATPKFWGDRMQEPVVPNASCSRLMLAAPPVSNTFGAKRAQFSFRKTRLAPNVRNRRGVEATESMQALGWA